MDRTKSKIKFVGLHAHSVAGSIFDALGYPQAHMDFAYENGMDALALTDHGNMNGLAYQVLHAKKMMADGKDFKPIFGCEAYFLPSLDDWRDEYQKAMEDKKNARKIKKEGQSGATVEDENSSKKTQDLLRRRRHLVLLAQNQTGLNNLFKLISESYLPENYYRYPRMDYALLKKYNEGIIAASACLGGVYAGNYWEHREEGEEAVLEAMRETTRKMLDVFGDRWYGEIQWNNVPEQHELNNYIIKVAQEFGVKLLSTADSHYPNPDAWKDRELYKRLGWLGKEHPILGRGVQSYQTQWTRLVMNYTLKMGTRCGSLIRHTLMGLIITMILSSNLLRRVIILLTSVLSDFCRIIRFAYHRLLSLQDIQKMRHL